MDEVATTNANSYWRGDQSLNEQSGQSDQIFLQQDVIQYLRRKGLSDETIQRLQVINSESVSFPVCLSLLVHNSSVTRISAAHIFCLE